MASSPPKVFFSYSHDSHKHMDRVLELADRLRSEGVDANLDQYEISPAKGWPQWMRRQIREADFVLVVCTATYEQRFDGEEESGKDKGVTWEGAILTQELYGAEKEGNRLVPVYFTAADETRIPLVLRGLTSYNVGSEAGYEELYRWLTNQPAVARPELGRLRQLSARKRLQNFATQDRAGKPHHRTPDEDERNSEEDSLLWRRLMSFHDKLAAFLVKCFTKSEFRKFILKNYKDGNEFLPTVPDNEISRLKFVNSVLSEMKQRALLEADGRRRLVGSLLVEHPDAQKEIIELANSIRENELDLVANLTEELPPLSYGAAAGEFRRFAEILPPPKHILAPQIKIKITDEQLPALEFVRGPRAEAGQFALPPELGKEILIHTIHAGHIIPNSLVEDPSVRDWFDRDEERDRFVEEKDWGANQMAQALANELALDGYLRMNVARCVLDFGRFPGVSPRNADHLHRLSINADLGKRIGREKVDELLNLYHQISSAFERAVWIESKSEEGEPKMRPRRIILGVHTYDRYNREGTLRPPVSLISRSRTYDLNRTMHPGSFDRLYPDELAEFTSDRCLLAAIAHALEREHIGVADNHPYSMPDGCVEIRSQVWYFFKFLRRRFEEAQRTGAVDEEGLSDSDYQRVWEMLLDTTLRHTESAALRSYVHRHRVSIHAERKDEFERYRRAYEAIAKFRNQRKSGRSGRAEIVDEYRLIPDRPSSLGVEVRKDLVWRYDDPHDDLDPRRIRWRIPVQESRAVIQENVRRIARLIAHGIYQYLVYDQSTKKKAKKLFDQAVDR